MKELYINTIAQHLAIRPWQVENCVTLFEEGSTIPFISRYRKERTGGLDDVEVAQIRHWADVFAEIRAAADDMDCGRLESIFSEMEGYSIPQAQKDLYGKLKAASDNYDYDKILELLDRE